MMAAPAGVVRDEAAPVENADVAAAVPEPVAEPVAEAEADVGDAVVAVFATLATEAMEEEAAARRLFLVSIKAHPKQHFVGGTHGSAAVQYCVTWFWTGGLSLLSGQLL
jgi:hypothetical protein